MRHHFEGRPGKAPGEKGVPGSRSCRNSGAPISSNEANNPSTSALCLGRELLLPLEEATVRENASVDAEFG